LSGHWLTTDTVKQRQWPHMTRSNIILNGERLHWMWWYMPVIPACRRLRREDQELQTSLGYHSETLAKKKKKSLGWWSGPSIRAPAWQACCPEFKPQN
jgi:hypothetical protein